MTVTKGVPVLARGKGKTVTVKEVQEMINDVGKTCGLFTEGNKRTRLRRKGHEPFHEISLREPLTKGGTYQVTYWGEDIPTVIKKGKKYVGKDAIFESKSLNKVMGFLETFKQGCSISRSWAERRCVDNYDGKIKWYGEGRPVCSMLQKKHRPDPEKSPLDQDPEKSSYETKAYIIRRIDVVIDEAHDNMKRFFAYVFDRNDGGARGTHNAVEVDQETFKEWVNYNDVSTYNMRDEDTGLISIRRNNVGEVPMRIGTADSRGDYIISFYNKGFPAEGVTNLYERPKEVVHALSDAKKLLDGFKEEDEELKTAWSLLPDKTRTTLENRYEMSKIVIDKLRELVEEGFPRPDYNAKIVPRTRFRKGVVPIDKRDVQLDDLRRNVNEFEKDLANVKRLRKYKESQKEELEILTKNVGKALPTLQKWAGKNENAQEVLKNFQYDLAKVEKSVLG